MSEIFDTDISGISRHLDNIFSSGELDENSSLQKMQIANSSKPVNFYNLDAIISVGYRVNSYKATFEGSCDPPTKERKNKNLVG